MQGESKLISSKVVALVREEVVLLSVPTESLLSRLMDRDLSASIHNVTRKVVIYKVGS